MRFLRQQMQLKAEIYRSLEAKQQEDARLRAIATTPVPAPQPSGKPLQTSHALQRHPPIPKWLVPMLFAAPFAIRLLSKVGGLAR